MRFIYPLAAVLVVFPAFAQKYEFGINGGGSFTQDKTVVAPRGEAKAGFESGYSGGFTLGNNMYKYVGGELRYTFQKQDLKVSSGSEKATFGGQSHAIHYDLLIHATSQAAKVRPYVSFGGGAIIFRGTGTEQAFQPLSNFAILTKTTETKGLISVGGGVKFAISKKLLFRVDVRDYLAPFPTNVIAPAPGTEITGWLNNIVPSAGITFIF